MQIKPSLSIILPIYQVASCILSCLQSIAGQNYSGKVEVILIDDCGTDNSMELARSFIDQYQGPFSFLVFTHPHNKGLSAARNTGMRHATGDYLLFVDSDDELLPDALMHLTAPLSQEPFDMVIGRMQMTDSVNNYEFNGDFPGGTALRGHEIVRQNVLHNTPETAWNKLCRRQMLIEHPVLFYEGIIHEDELWSFHISLVAKSQFVIDEKTYLYKIRPGSINKTRNIERRVTSLHVVYREMIALAISNGLLKDRDVFSRIDVVRLWILFEFRSDIKRCLQEYLALRKVSPLRRIDYLIISGLHPLRQLRRFHFILPARLGALYQFIWL